MDKKEYQKPAIKEERKAKAKELFGLGPALAEGVRQGADRMSLAYKMKSYFEQNPPASPSEILYKVTQATDLCNLTAPEKEEIRDLVIDINKTLQGDAEYLAKIPSPLIPVLNPFWNKLIRG